jgi:hypothetical protein
VKSKLDKKITYHGQQRLAGPDATRGKVLSEKEAFNTKYNAIAKRTTFKQTNGPTVYLEKLPSGRYNGVVEGNYGLITTMKNWSARDLANMGKNQHWPEYEIKDLENSDY